MWKYFSFSFIYFRKLIWKSKSSLDYDINPKVRNAGKINFLTDKKGANMAMLIELQGRAITPKPYKSRKSI